MADVIHVFKQPTQWSGAGAHLCEEFWQAPSWIESQRSRLGGEAGAGRGEARRSPPQPSCSKAPSSPLLVLCLERSRRGDAIFLLCSAAYSAQNCALLEANAAHVQKL